MIRSTLSRAALVALVVLSGCTMTPGTVCKDASGRSIENPDYCKLYPAQHVARTDVACHPAPRAPTKS